MAVAVLDRFQQESKYRSCPPGQKKSGRCGGGGGRCGGGGGRCGEVAVGGGWTVPL